MLIHTVSQYLESHKRLVVPQLGTFIVKEPGRSVLFSELLKRDDGVLRGLLCEEGLNEMEAAGEIDRFVFEVRHAVEHGREFPLEGFGTMKPGPNGTIAFLFEPRPEPSEPAEPAVPAAPADAAPRREVYVEPRISPSVKLNPEPYVKGLRYGKPHKTTAAYTYVDKPPRRRTDRFLVVAILAAVIAVAAIAFGYWRQARENRAESAYPEQVQNTVIHDDAQLVTPGQTPPQPAAE